MNENLRRLLELVDEVFATRNDPSQIGFSDEDMAKMEHLHGACLQEAVNDEGPVAWVAVIPTSLALMNDFLEGRIDERKLFDLTTTDTKLEAVYLCSAVVLPEYRNSGIALGLTVDAIRDMQREHTITHAFVWPFSAAGEQLAQKAAGECRLPLSVKTP